MRKFLLKIMVLFSTISAFQSALATDWGYTQRTGPSQWGILGYPICDIGKQQSPVDIVQVMPANNNRLTFNYQPGVYRLERNDHNLYVVAANPSANSLVYDGRQYQLQSFHFHTPSEHQIRDVQYPLEGHFIHEDNSGHILVVGVFFRVAKANPALKKVFAEPLKRTSQVNIAALFPTKKDFYVYPGSLTTPPCTEGLTWVVLANPVEISREQLQFFKTHVTRFNARPPQPLKDRVITQNPGA